MHKATFERFLAILNINTTASLALVKERQEETGQVTISTFTKTTQGGLGEGSE